MTKAEAMKLRMLEEREGGSGSAMNINRTQPMGQNNNVSNGGGAKIQMENI
jgi:hypothetical protein